MAAYYDYRNVHVISFEITDIDISMTKQLLQYVWWYVTMLTEYNVGINGFPYVFFKCWLLQIALIINYEFNNIDKLSINVENVLMPWCRHVNALSSLLIHLTKLSKFRSSYVRV